MNYVRKSEYKNIGFFGRFFFFIVFSVLASGAEAALNPNVSAKLHSLSNEGEGYQITEDFLRRGDRPGTQAQRELKKFMELALPSLDESVRHASWNETHMGIDGPACFDAAPKLGLLLRAAGLPGYVVACGHHVFIVAETRDANLLIDPTIRQYFGQDLAPKWVPKIFVGTLSELKALFQKEPGLPILPYQDIYFNSEWPAYRRDSKMLQQRNRILFSSENKEYFPLSDFLNRWLSFN